MTGLQFQNGKPAQMAIGKYQTRNNRPVDIESFRDVQVDEPGGSKVTKRLWRGKLYQMNGRDVESEYEWSNLGTFLHSEGCANGYDLQTVISQVEPEPETAAPAVLENQLLCTALVDMIGANADSKGETPLDALNRIIAQRNDAREMVKKLLAQQPVLA